MAFFFGSCIKLSLVIRSNPGDFFGSMFVLISLTSSLGFIGGIWQICVFTPLLVLTKVFSSFGRKVLSK